MSFVRRPVAPLRVAASAVFVMLCASAAWAQDLALKRVMLSSGGVGYFEYEAQVENDATLNLRVALDQVDDVLKSLVVYDDKGGVGGVSLPGREPLSQAFKDLPFDRQALESPATLLNALRGAEVSATGSRTVSGRIVAVEEEQATSPDGKTVTTRHRVTVSGEKGLQQFILQDAESLTFKDETLRKQVEHALAAMNSNRAKDARTVSVSTKGQGKRTVRVAYLVAAPLWKASYRLTLPADPTAQKAGLQGWAVVENLSGVDWKDVELTLVSGKPVAFRQALYQAYFVDRPEVPVEVVGRLLPRVDAGGVGHVAGAVAGAVPAPPPPPAPAPRAADAMRERMAMAPPGAVAAPPPMAKAAEEAEATESLTQVVFKLPRSVTVENGKTLSVPILDREAPALKIALYQPETNLRHPLASIRLLNDGATGLPPGIITVYERGAQGDVAYIGDARLSALPPGESRLLSYALDQKITVEREVGQTQRTAAGRIANAVLTVDVRQRQIATYRVKGPKEPRLLVVEQPQLAGWRLTTPEDQKGVELSERRYRIPFVMAPSGDTQTFTVAQETTVEQRVQLVSASADAIGVWARAAELDQKTRDALNQAARLQAAVVAAQQRVAQIDQRLKTIVQDQERIRANLGTVPSNTDLHRRYLATLTTQENDLEAARKEREAAEKAVETARAELARFVASLG